MTGRTDDVVKWWVRLYTRGVAADVAKERRDEIDSDLFEHRAAAHTAGVRAEGAIVRRALAGIMADIFWREREVRRLHSARMASLSPARRRSIGRVVAATYALGALLIVIGVVAVERLWTPGGINVMVPTIREGILAATIACVVSLLFALRPTSRMAGMLGLAVAVIPLTYGVMRGLDGISARASYVLYRLSNLMPGELTMWVVYLGPGILAALLLCGGALRLRRLSTGDTATG